MKTTNAQNCSWKIKRKEILFEDEGALKVEVESLVTERGEFVDRFYQIYTRPSCSIVSTTIDDRIVMIRQYKHGARKTCLTFPGGRLNSGELYTEAAARELLEETGYKADDIHLIGKYPIHANQYVGEVGIVVGLGAEYHCIPDSGDLEQMRVVLLTLSEVQSALNSGEIGLLGDAAAFALFSLFKAGILDAVADVQTCDEGDDSDKNIA